MRRHKGVFVGGREWRSAEWGRVSEESEEIARLVFPEDELGIL